MLGSHCKRPFDDVIKGHFCLFTVLKIIFRRSATPEPLEKASNFTPQHDLIFPYIAGVMAIFCFESLTHPVDSVQATRNKEH
jgi:hypothetical protein